jgi:hypothetical protein
MGAVLTKILRQYDLKLLAASSAAIVIVGSQQHRLLATARLFQQFLERFPVYARLKSVLARLPPTPAEVAKWDIAVLSALAVPVACSILYSAMPEKLDDNSLKAQASETAKRFKELQEILQFSFVENGTLLTGLLEFQPDEQTFLVPSEPRKSGFKMPADKPLEDRLACSRIISQVHQADECRASDPLVSHGLIVAAAALVYELEYVRRETLRWHAEFGALPDQDENNAPKRAPKMEKYRSGQELQTLVEGTAEQVSCMILLIDCTINRLCCAGVRHDPRPQTFRPCREACPHTCCGDGGTVREHGLRTAPAAAAAEAVEEYEGAELLYPLRGCIHHRRLYC